MSASPEIDGVIVEENKKKVMVAIDETQESYHALLWVLGNFQELLTSSNPLLIFAAEPPPDYTNTFAASFSNARLYCTVSPNAGFVNNVQEQDKKVALGLLEKAKSICTSRGVNAVTISEVGDAKEAICTAVDNHKITLLVLAEQTLGRIMGTFSWSVSDYCVHYANCSVLVFKQTDEQGF